MRDDVVEYAGFLAQIAQVDLLELDVGETQRRDVGGALAHLDGGKVNAEEAGARQGGRHRNQVPSGGATDFEHSAFADRRGYQPVQPGDCRKPVRMRLRKRQAQVREFVVACLQLGVHRGGQFSSSGATPCRDRAGRASGL